PGGGVATLHCAHRLLSRRGATPAEQVAIDAFANGLGAPFSRLCYRSGRVPGSIVRALDSGPGYCCDLITGRMVDSHNEGPLDPARIVRAAIAESGEAAARFLEDLAANEGRPT